MEKWLERVLFEIVLSFCFIVGKLVCLGVVLEFWRRYFVGLLVCRDLENFLIFIFLVK